MSVNNNRSAGRQMKRKQASGAQNRTTAATGVSGGAPRNDDATEDIRRLRALSVLEHLAESPRPPTLAQLVGSMRVPKSTLMRLVHTMRMHGYLLQLPGQGGYLAGPQSTALALNTLRGPSIRRECRSVLRTLVLKLEETCNLTVPDAGRVLYVERVETTEPLRMHLEPGTWVPMHCTASGKLFLASTSLLDRRRALAHFALKRHTPRTIVDRQEMDLELGRIAKNGIGIDNEEFVRGMVAVAVPVFDKDGDLIAAIACHAPTARLSLAELLASVPRMRAAAEEMRAVLFPH